MHTMQCMQPNLILTNQFSTLITSHTGIKASYMGGRKLCLNSCALFEHH